MSYRGVVAEIPLGRTGLQASANERELPPTALTRAESVTLENRVVEKEGGAVLFDATGIPNIRLVEGLFDWWPDATTQRLITATEITGVGTRVFKEVGGDLDAVTLFTGVAQPRYFVVGGKEAAANPQKLFAFSFNGFPRVLAGDGVTMTALALPPADWNTGGLGSNFPTAGIIHQGRLWAWGNTNDPNRLYASTATNHEDFVGAGSLTFPVYPGVGRRLVNAAVYAGRLYLFKFPKGIFFLDDTAVDPATWTIRQVSDAVGAANTPRAVLPIDNDILFVTADGAIQALSVTEKFGGTETADFSEQIGIRQLLRERAHPKPPGGGAAVAGSVWYGATQQAWFVLHERSGAGSFARLRVVLDFSEVPRGGAVKVTTSTRESGTVAALALRQGADGVERPMLAEWGGGVGDPLGSKVYLLDQATRTKAGALYVSTIETADTDFGWMSEAADIDLTTREKLFEFFEVESAAAATTLTAEVLLDGTHTQTLLLDLARGRTIGRLTGSAYRAKVRLTHTAATNFQLRAIRWYFRPGGARRVTVIPNG